MRQRKRTTTFVVSAWIEVLRLFRNQRPTPPALHNKRQRFIVHGLRFKETAMHFGLAAPTLYGWVSNGRLLRGKHYLKVGGRVVMIQEAFIDFLFQEDGTNGDTRAQRAAMIFISTFRMDQRNGLFNRQGKRQRKTGMWRNQKTRQYSIT